MLRLLHNLRTNTMKPKINDIVTITIYGRAMRARVLAVHRAGTLDVQIKTGECYRVSGLNFN